MPEYKEGMGPREIMDFESELTREYLDHKNQTDKDLQFRISGVGATRGSSGKQFVGYDTLAEFYRGDQWDHDEPPGASQKTENYCATIVDNFSSLMFDAPVEISCPSQDETDDLLEMKAEIKEKMLNKVYDDNDADDEVFPELSKVGSLYGDSFIIGPMLDKNGSDNRKDWKIVFYNADNPANIRPIFADENYKRLIGYIDTTMISPLDAVRRYKTRMDSRGLDPKKIIEMAKGRAVQGLRRSLNVNTMVSYQRMLVQSKYWTDKVMAIFLEDNLIDWWYHDWRFVPVEYIRNIYVPNHPYGKSDLEDVIDPQLFYSRVNNDLANAIKFLSTINLQGKNLDGMEVLIHGLSKIFNLPEDGELKPIERSGDPYASSSFVDGRRRAILDVSGVSESLMSTIQNSNPSGRAMAVAMQSVIRKLNPRIKRYQKALRSLNRNILKLIEIYWPETKDIIGGDYTNEVNIISTLLRNIIDELNKLQSGVQSLTTTQKNIGVPQPKIEQKRMRKDLSDPILGPQVARQPGLLQIQSPEQEPGATGSDGNQLPSAPNQAAVPSSANGSVTAGNQRAAQGAPVPTVVE